MQVLAGEPCFPILFRSQNCLLASFLCRNELGHWVTLWDTMYPSLNDCQHYLLCWLKYLNSLNVLILLWSKLWFYTNSDIWKKIKYKMCIHMLQEFSLSNHIRAAKGLWLDRRKGGGAKSGGDSISREKRKENRHADDMNQPQLWYHKVRIAGIKLLSLSIGSEIIVLTSCKLWFYWYTNLIG